MFQVYIPRENKGRRQADQGPYARAYLQPHFSTRKGIGVNINREGHISTALGVRGYIPDHIDKIDPTKWTLVKTDEWSEISIDDIEGLYSDRQRRY